jgi:hypothetical protein
MSECTIHVTHLIIDYRSHAIEYTSYYSDPHQAHMHDMTPCAVQIGQSTCGIVVNLCYIHITRIMMAA